MKTTIKHTNGTARVRIESEEHSFSDLLRLVIPRYKVTPEKVEALRLSLERGKEDVK